MENQKDYRHILLFYFRKGKNASQAHKKLCAVYGDEALKERQCQNWFDKFRSGDFSLKDEKRSGRSVEVNDDLIKAIIDSDRHSTTPEIAEKLHVSHTCIENHLKQLGYVQKLDIWVPHELKEKHLTQRINCDLLKKRNENDPFLKRLAMKNGLFTTISSGKDRGTGHVNQLKQHQKLVFVERRFCYQFGGITKELSILNSYPTERSILSSTSNN